MSIERLKALSAIAETLRLLPAAVFIICNHFTSLPLFSFEDGKGVTAEANQGTLVHEDLWPGPEGNCLPSSRTMANSMASFNV